MNEERLKAAKADDRTWRRYPRLDAALEMEGPAIVANLENTRAEIRRLSHTGAGREKERARAALAAYERALELYHHLATIRDEELHAASNMRGGTAINE